MSQPWVVLPTYNERGNIEAMVSTILAVAPVSILIVDDGSPDGTGDLADQLAAKHHQVHVLHRQAKQGLGRAYMAGIQYVLDQGATEVIHLDADRSHPTDLVPVVLAALQQADLVIASRYVAGGRLDIPLHRRIISQAGNEYIRFMLGPKIRDWSTGYKAWRADLLRTILPKATLSAGYAWLMEMNWLALQAGGRVAEVPMVFTERQAGKSKFSVGIIWEDIRVAWQLRRRKA